MPTPPRSVLRLALSCALAPLLAPAAEEPARERLDLWPEGVPGLRADAAADREENGRVFAVHRPTLTVFPAPAATANGTAAIVCPGGAYQRLAVDHEGAQIAAWLNSLGVTAFVLRYRLVEYGRPAPLQDALRALRIVRTRAADWHVRPDRLGIIGFSAGGHLASTTATLFDAPEGRTGAALDATSGRPDFAILLYPVITLAEPHAHAGSRKSLLGENPSPELVARWSTDRQVTGKTPPTFLVHTLEDKTVPVENALLFYQALRAAGVPAEMHLFEHGPHGFGLRPGVGPGADWPPLCAQWLRSHGWLPAAPP